VIWPTVRALLNRDAARAPPAIHGYSGLKLLPNDKANAIADYLENRFTHHDLCGEHRERRVEAIVQALLETEDPAPSEKIRPLDLKKLINSLKIKRSCGIYGIPNECLRHLPRRPLVHLTRCSTSVLGYHIFYALGRKQK